MGVSAVSKSVGPEQSMAGDNPLKSGYSGQIGKKTNHDNCAEDLHGEWLVVQRKRRNQHGKSGGKNKNDPSSSHVTNDFGIASKAKYFATNKTTNYAPPAYFVFNGSKSPNEPKLLIKKKRPRVSGPQEVSIEKLIENASKARANVKDRQRTIVGEGVSHGPTVNKTAQQINTPNLLVDSVQTDITKTHPPSQFDRGKGILSAMDVKVISRNHLQFVDGDASSSGVKEVAASQAGEAMITGDDCKGGPPEHLEKNETPCTDMHMG
ncbi:Glycosyl transferase group 1 [Sesbania bispinosa]|nr:Glycosyl transferase group 1 [Sesbania bispinosa]